MVVHPLARCTNRVANHDGAIGLLVSVRDFRRPSRLFWSGEFYWRLHSFELGNVDLRIWTHSFTNLVRCKDYPRVLPRNASKHLSGAHGVLRHDAIRAHPQSGLIFFLSQLAHSLLVAGSIAFNGWPSPALFSTHVLTLEYLYWYVQASVDQSTLDIMLAFFFGSALAIYFNLLGAIVVMTQTAWPIIIVLIPLAFVYFSYQVCTSGWSPRTIPSQLFLLGTALLSRMWREVSCC